MFATNDSRGAWGVRSDELAHLAKSGRSYKRMLLVDDHDLFRQVLAVLFEHYTDFDRSIQAKTCVEARREVNRAGGRVDFAFVDLDLPDAVVLIGELDAAGVPVLAVTASQDSTRHARAFGAGAREVLTTAVGADDLLGAVRRIGG